MKIRAAAAHRLFYKEAAMEHEVYFVCYDFSFKILRLYKGVNQKICLLDVIFIRNAAKLSQIWSTALTHGVL